MDFEYDMWPPQPPTKILWNWTLPISWFWQSFFSFKTWKQDNIYLSNIKLWYAYDLRRFQQPQWPLKPKWPLWPQWPQMFIWPQKSIIGMWLTYRMNLLPIAAFVASMTSAASTASEAMLTSMASFHQNIVIPSYLTPKWHILPPLCGIYHKKLCILGTF